MEDMMNTEGRDNDNNMMIRERRTGGESSPDWSSQSSLAGMKYVNKVGKV
jgi:hypothetical protein